MAIMDKNTNGMIQKLYGDLKTVHDKNMPIWQSTSRYVGISVDPNYMNNKTRDNRAGEQLDKYVDDPTSAISVNQSGDYMLGIVWGPGDGVVEVVPSRYVKDKVADERTINDWYGYISDQNLYHMNHKDAGLMASFRPYAYDQFSFGNSGVGAFINQDFLTGADDNAFIFKHYGVDNTVIDEGKNGLIEYVFLAYNWTINNVVGELCMKDGVIDEGMIAQLPKPLQDAYKKNDYTSVFQIVFGFYPRTDYNPKLKGKKGTKYKGVWFLDNPNHGQVFKEEDFKTKPIAWARQIKIRGHVYGRSSGGMLLSTIRSVNFMVSNTIEIVEKLSDPSLGVYSNAVFGDGVIDTSAQGLTVFNSSLTGSQSPVFPLYDVGDPSAIISFLLPYLNEKIVTAFKVDSLLDFSSAKEMTATESLQRYAIRGKSLAGMLQQQKTEMLEPLVSRCVSLLYDIGELGVNPRKDEKRVKELKQLGKQERIIPEEVLATIDEGKPWFELRFNNELEKMIRTEAIENLIKLIQSIGVIAQMYPQIIEAVDWYTLLDDINTNLDANNKILIGADEFKAKLQAIAEQQQQAVQLQAGQAVSDIGKSQAETRKLEREDT